jgi:NAD(P)-dependent dehydrogenase (short-subunit alcohol dehydrogenase family)
MSSTREEHQNMTSNNGRRVAVVTGAGKSSGIGYEVCRQLGKAGMTVVLTGRDGTAVEDRTRELEAEGLDVLGRVVDVTSASSVASLSAFLAQSFGRVDVLVNNAAATSTHGEQPSTADLERARESMDATLFGGWRVTQSLVPLLERSEHGRVVNVSSGAGSHGDTAFGLTTNNSMGPAYAVAKAAVNALTVTFANELRGANILVNAVCPGFTATFPGGESMGARPVTDGAASVVWAAVLEDGGPSGGFFRDGKPLPW